MRILVVGGGGREHAIVQALVEGPGRHEVLVAPGNPGTAELSRNLDVRADDLDGLVRSATAEAVDLVVVGPEIPLVLGLADRLDDAGIPVFGPSAAAARLEGSKAFAKAFMDRHGIPTAAHRTFAAGQHQEARAYAVSMGAPLVVKASGLAAGKGVVVCATVGEAVAALDAMMLGGEFGAAGESVVVESFLEGEEASLFAVSDGRDYVLLAAAQDHKRIGDDDTGPNTGGMGAYAPAPVVTKGLLVEAARRIVEPTLRGMAAEGTPYRGVLYVGLMVSSDGLRVVEYNCRLGDPEAQVVLRLVASDVGELFLRAATGRLAGTRIEERGGAAACVVLASEGYPGPPVTGRSISGVGEAGWLEGVSVFHARTRAGSDGGLVTAGGRVLAVSALGRDLAQAVERAYAATGSIRFDGMQFRRDIGRKGLRRLEE